MATWNLPPLIGVYAPGLAAFAVALLGVLLLRRNERWWPLAAAVAVAAGWMLLLPFPRTWLHPRVLLDHLVVPAGVGVVAGALLPWLRGRLRGYVAFGLLGLAGWWLAGAAGARGEFWRVWFAVSAAAWLLRRFGGAAAPGATLVGVLLGSGLLLFGAAPVWVGVAAVLAAVPAAFALLRPGAVLGSIAPAAGLVAIDLGTGGLLRGRVGTVDLLCLAAPAAPQLSRLAERAIGRRFGRHARWVAGLLTVAGLVALATAAAWLIRR